MDGNCALGGVFLTGLDADLGANPLDTGRLGQLMIGSYSLSRDVLSTFARGAFDGALYDYPNISSLYNNSTGTTPVSVVTDPVGLSLDSRLGLVLGPTVYAQDFSGLANRAALLADGWSEVGTATIGISSGKLSLASAAGYDQTRKTVTGFTSGKWYKISADIGASTNATYIDATAGGAGTSKLGTTARTDTFYLFTSATSVTFAFINTGVDTTTFDNISVRLFEGNHAIQATAGARPTWQVDAQGFYYLSFLGTDDSLTSATGGGGSAGLTYCRVIQPTGGAGTLRTLWADNGTNTGYKIQLDVNNKLSFSAGNGTAFTTLVSTAAINVGDKPLITVRDNGTLLSVQINSTTPQTVARPVVVAGTAGFTIGKDNGAASSYDITNQYSGAYYKDTGLTDAQVAAVQSWVRSKAGL